jgi:hypothetical protein
MEYYDSINKKELYQFYFEKSNKLLQNPGVIKKLDENSVNLADNSDIKLFAIDPYQIVKSKTPTSHRRRRSVTEPDETSTYAATLTQESIDSKKKFSSSNKLLSSGFQIERMQTFSHFKSAKKVKNIFLKLILIIFRELISKI